jgi:hypothetical protein
MDEPHYRFHARAWARPAGDPPRTVRLLGNEAYETVTLGPGHPSPLLGRTFEQATAELARFPRLFIEPDGAWVWVGEAGRPWQLDGQLLDGGPALAGVEMRGECPPSALDRVLAACGGMGEAFVFELVMEAVILDERVFRQWAIGRVEEQTDGGMPAAGQLQ